MFPQRIALLVSALLLLTPASSQALELGVQDAAAPIEQRNEWATHVNATWERIIVVPGQPDAAQKIRDSHAAGRNVILTIGGGGTTSRHQNFRQALRFINSLPRAERYTISNEPDLDGWKPCAYRKAWMEARRSLGRRLLWGDLSPFSGVNWTIRASRCGALPKSLDMAVHPYCRTNPLAPCDSQWTVGIGSLPSARQTLSKAGIRVRWWLTEFGYGIDYAGTSMTDAQAAGFWPGAITIARRVHARVLVIYTAQGPTWNSRPGVQAWAAIRAT